MVAVALRKLNSVQEASGTGWRAHKQGRIVVLICQDLPIGTSELLPDGFRPMGYVEVAAKGNDPATNNCGLAVRWNGRMTVYGAGKSTTVNAVVTFVVGG